MSFGGFDRCDSQFDIPEFFDRDHSKPSRFYVKRYQKGTPKQRKSLWCRRKLHPRTTANSGRAKPCPTNRLLDITKKIRQMLTKTLEASQQKFIRLLPVLHACETIIQESSKKNRRGLTTSYVLDSNSNNYY